MVMSMFITTLLVAPFEEVLGRPVNPGNVMYFWTVPSEL